MKIINDYIFECNMTLPCCFIFLYCRKCKADVRCNMCTIAVKMMLEGKY